MDPPGAEGPASRLRGRAWTWAELMRRAFALDVLACPVCGGRLRLIALIFAPPRCGPSWAPRSRRPRSPTAPRPPPCRDSRLIFLPAGFNCLAVIPASVCPLPAGSRAARPTFRVDSNVVGGEPRGREQAVVCAVSERGGERGGWGRR